MRKVRRALAAAALLGAAVTAGSATGAGAQSSENGSGDGDAVAQLPAPSGYWLVGADGGIFNYGEAGFHGSMGNWRLNEPVVDMAATMSGRGYWEVALDGGIFSFGDAAFHDSMGGRLLTAPMVGIAPTPTGGGYWTVAADGGVFAFGDAEFHGSMGGAPLVAPVVGIVPTPAGHGYWLVAEDGGVFAFGDAPFAGSLGGDPPDEPIVGLAASGDGYVTVTAEGRIDAFGAPEVGSLPIDEVEAPIMDVANDANSEGFWLAAADGTVHALEGAHHWGDARDVPLNAPVMALASVAPDSKAPSIVGGLTDVGATTVTFTADEPLDPDSIDIADFAETSDAVITEVATGGGGATITLTFDDSGLALDDTVTLLADSVTDLAGNAGPAEDVIVTVADLTAPTITAGEVDGTTATFSADEPLDPGSVGTEDVEASSEAEITTVELDGLTGTTITVTFDGPLADGDTATLLARSVTDLAGNAAPEADVVATAPDRTGPGVEAGTVDGDTATFVADEALDPTSVAAADVATSSDAAITSAVLEDDGLTITVTFDGPLADGDTVTLAGGSVEDVAGNAGPAAPVVLTAADRTGPTVTAGAVAEGATTVVFTANEPLDADSVAEADIEETSDAGVASVAAVGATVTVTFDAGLLEDETVTLLAGSVDDAQGNAGPAADVVATVGPADAAPFITSATAIDNSDGVVSPNFDANPDDGWLLNFSEPVTEASAEVARFIISDGVTEGVFICNPGGCALSVDGLSLSINVQGLPVEDDTVDPLVPVAGIEYPATITGFASGFAPEDVAGNPVDLAVPGADNVLDAGIP